MLRLRGVPRDPLEQRWSCGGNGSWNAFSRLSARRHRRTSIWHAPERRDFRPNSGQLPPGRLLLAGARQFRNT